MSQPLISIMIPVYNVEAYLDQCLTSLVNQTYTNWKAILVEDCTPDKGRTYQLAQQWEQQDERVHLFQMPKNSGVAAVRNRALQEVEGEYFTFLDSDDFLEPDHLSSMVSVIQKYNCEVAVTGVRECYHDGKHRKDVQMQPLGYAWSQPKLTLHHMMDNQIKNYLWNKLFRIDALEQFHFPDGHNFEDVYAFTPIMHKVQLMVHTGQATYNYRQHDASITKVDSPKNMYDCAYAIAHRIEYMHQHMNCLTPRHIKLLEPWFHKSFVYQYKKALALPDSPDKEKVVQLIEQVLKKYNWNPALKFRGIRMFGLSLRKRYAEMVFRYY